MSLCSSLSEFIKLSLIRNFNEMVFKYNLFTFMTKSEVLLSFSIQRCIELYRSFKSFSWIRKDEAMKHLFYFFIFPKNRLEKCELLPTDNIGFYYALREVEGGF